MRTLATKAANGEICPESIDEAVIASDALNQTRFLNLAGEALSGWSREDAAGEPLAATAGSLRHSRHASAS